MKRTAALVLLAVPVLLGLFGLLVACYGPTEVRIEVSTDVPCIAVADAGRATAKVRTTIAVGASAAEALVAADTMTCDLAPGGGDSAIGSLVVVPSGPRDAHVTVTVTMTTDGGHTEDCKPVPVGKPAGDCSVSGTCKLPGNCIVARRIFAFISHSARSLPIKVYARCAGKACGDQETCGRTGECESAAVQSCGSIASDCVPNPVDASVSDVTAEAGEAGEAGDAGDAGGVARRRCFVPPNNILAPVDDTSALLAGNSTHLFWPGGGAQGGPTKVQTVEKTGDAGAVRTLSATALTGPYTALAADDESVWIATAITAQRYDLTKMSPALTSIANITAITIGPRPPGGQPNVYLTRTVNPETFVAKSDSQPVAWTPSSLGNVTGGIAVAASATRFYILGGGSLYRYNADGSGPPQIFPADGGIDVAVFGSSAFFSVSPINPLATVKGIYRLGDTATAANTLVAGAGLGRLAVDASFVYYLRNIVSGDGGASTAGVLRTPNSNASNPAPVVAEGFGEVHGLVVDDACAYFIGQPTGGLARNLYVYPIDPTAPPANR